MKRECVYLNPADTVGEKRRCITKYINYYNNRRHHQGIGNHIPADLCPKENPDLETTAKASKGKSR